jgi:hypothetical protein
MSPGRNLPDVSGCDVLICVISRIATQVMVNTECPSRHSNSSGNVDAGIILHYWIFPSIDRDPFRVVEMGK